MASVNQTQPHCVNQMGKRYSKLLADRHGRGMAWARHAMCESAFTVYGGPGSSVGIATELRAGRSGDRIPVGRVFSPFQTGPGAQPTSCTTGSGSFLEVKLGRGVTLTPHPF